MMGKIIAYISIAIVAQITRSSNVRANSDSELCRQNGTQERPPLHCFLGLPDRETTLGVRTHEVDF